MAYDPFAPGSPMMPQPPQQMPPTLAPNNALGPVAGNTGIVPPNMTGGPVMTPGGGGTGAPLQGGAAPPGAVPPGGFPPNWQQLMQQYGMMPPDFMQRMHGMIGIGSGQWGGFDRMGYRQALTDWRGNRPQMGDGGGGTINGLMDWRSQRPSRRDFFAAPGATPGTPPATPTVPGTTAIAPTGVMPINPAAGQPVPPDYLTTGSLGG